MIISGEGNSFKLSLIAVDACLVVKVYLSCVVAINSVQTVRLLLTDLSYVVWSSTLLVLCCLRLRYLTIINFCPFVMKIKVVLLICDNNIVRLTLTVCFTDWNLHCRLALHKFHVGLLHDRLFNASFSDC